MPIRLVVAGVTLMMGLVTGAAMGQQYGPPSTGNVSSIFMVPALLEPVAGFNPATGHLNGAGYAGDGMTADSATSKFNYPVGTAYDSNGNLFIADGQNYVIRRIDHVTGDLSTFAGNGTFTNSAVQPSANTQAITVSLGLTAGLTIDSDNNVYFTDRTNNLVWKVTSAGIISIVAGGGTGTCAGTLDSLGDGCPALDGTLNNPWAVGVDASNNLYISDSYNNLIRKVSSSTGIMSIFAGDVADASGGCGSTLYSSPTGPYLASQAHLCFPLGVAFDKAGNAYIADANQNVVRKVDTTGHMTTFAGTGARYSSGNGGPATAATFNSASGVSVDTAGRVYISDFFGAEVRMVDLSGNIIDVLGDSAGGLTNGSIGTPDTEPEAYQAEYTGAADGIYGITMDPSGNLITSDSSGEAITSAGTTGGYFFGSQQIYQTWTSTALNTGSPFYPPYVLITNPSLVTLDITSAPTITGPFSIAGGTCTFPGSVAPGQSCTVVVAFTPTADQAYTGSISFDTNVSATPSSIVLTGTGIGAAPLPDPALTTPLPFASPVGVTSTPQQVTLTNNGQIAFSLGGTMFAYNTDNAFAVSGTNCGATLNAGDSCVYDLTFTPDRATTFSAGFYVDITTQSYGYIHVPLTGTGTGIVTLTPVAFGDVVAGQTSATMYATLSNGGADGMFIEGISLAGANPGSFTITTGTNACATSGVLDGGGFAGDTCNIYLTFTPASAVSLSATLQVTLHDPAASTTSTETANLTGTGVVFSSNVGTAEASQLVTVNFSTAGTLNATQVLTQGVPGLDFTATTGGSCTTGTAYAAEAVCTVNVVFDPRRAGAVKGSVLLTDASGVVLGTTYLPGTGLGPQVTFGPGTRSTLPFPPAGFSAPLGAAVDANETIYVSDTLNNRILKLPSDGVTFGTYTTVLVSGLNQPGGMAVDGNGNIWIADTENYRIVEVPWNGTAYGSQVVLGASVTLPEGVAVDGNGDVFIADTNGDRIVEVPWTGTGYGAQVVVPTTGLRFPKGIAVDANENVYVADTGNGRILELPRNGAAFGTQIELPATGLFQPFSLAVVGGGSLYIADSDAGLIVELPWNGTAFGAQVTLPFTGLNDASGLTVDGLGNVYVADSGNNNVAKFELAVPPALSFATTGVGATSTDSPQTVPVTNIGTASLIFTAGSNPNYPADFPENTTDANLCSSAAALMESASCDVSVKFKPTVAGPLSEDVVLTDNNLNVVAASQPISVSGTGTAAAAPTVTLLPGVLPFGNQLVGTMSVAQAVTLTNTGTVAVNISSISVLGANPTQFKETTGCGSVLGPLSDCTFSIIFAPQTTGAFSATLSVSDGGAGSPQTVTLTGTGVQPAVTLVPTSLSFGNQIVNTTSAAQTVTLTNTGTGPLIVDDVNRIGANINVFAEIDACAALSPIAPGASCTIKVTFLPTVQQPYSISLQIVDDAPGSPQSVPITGTGVPAAPVVTLLPSPLAFGNVATGTTSGQMLLKLSNTGTGPFPISSTSFGGSTNFAISYANNATTCGSSAVAAGSSCVYAITFTPAATGPASAMFTVTDTTDSVTASATLTGTGTAAAAPIASLTPATLAFPNTSVGTTSSALYASLHNTGTATLTNIVISITGVNPADFALSTGSNACGTTLPLDSSCNIYATFNPATASTFSGILQVTDNAAGSPQTATLMGTGTAAPAPIASLTPATLAFPATPVGTVSSALYASLHNTGSASLTNIVINITGVNPADFALSTGSNACGATLPLDSSCNIYVTFNPATAAAFSGVLQVTDNAAGSPQTATLTGTGTAPQLTITPPSLTFASQGLNTTSALMTVTFQNTGNALLAFANPPGGNASYCDGGCGITGDFTVLGGTCNFTSLTPGASCTLTITFTPTQTGTRTGVLTVATFSASGMTSILATVPLTGSGAAAPAPAAALAPNPVTFASQTPGTTSAATQVTLSNSGTAALSISGITIGGTNPSDFAITTSDGSCGTSLAAGASCPILVTFTPAAAGSFTATLSVADNASGSPQTVTLNGTGTAPVVADFTIAASPATQTVQAGASASYTITVGSSGGSFNNPVALSVTGLPAGTTASFAPTSVTPGSSSAKSTMTVTSAATVASVKSNEKPPLWPFATPLLAFMVLLPFRRWRKVWSGKLLILVIAIGSLAAACTLSACGGGFGFAQSKTYTLTVTGTSGSDTHSTTVQLTVQ